MASFLNGVRFRPTTAGTGDWTVDEAVQGYLTPANAGAVDGATYRYRAESRNLLEWEIGTSVYTAATQTFTRTVSLSSNSNAKVNFTRVPDVALVALAEDLSAISIFTATDAGLDALYGWDDSAGYYKNFALADILTEAAPATGDFAVIIGAEGDLRKVDWSNVGDITGTTGSTDNAVLRADGTGGGSVQSSAIAIDDSGNVTGIGTIDVGNADTTISRTGAGAIAVEGVGVALNSISLAHTASQVEIGHATDTTVARVSAGVISVEGETVHTNSTSRPLTASTIELGAATDTTLSRPAAARVQVEGEELLSTKDLSAILTSTQKSLLRNNTGSPSVIVPQGRLTVTTATPVITSTTSAQTTVYYTPYVGCLVPLYDGTYWTPTVFAELSQATTDSTKSPAACTTNSNYDLFVWSDSGTLRCTRGPAWSSGTTRGTGAGTTELVRTNGILLNAVSITNGPAASRGTYVGTIRTNGSSQVDFIFGASATGGTAGFVGVWNAYNRVKFSHFVRDDTNTWTYNGSYRSSNASDAMRVSFVRGLNEDGVFAFASVMMTNSASSAGHAGIALDATNTNNGTGGEGAVSTSGAQPCCYANPAVGLGFHFLQLTEATTGAAVNVTFMGDNGSQANYGNGLVVEVMA